MSESDWDTVMNVHLRGAFLLTRAVQAHMVDAAWGRIVNLSSTSALGNRGQANYAAAKAGIQGFTKTLAIELGRYGITANNGDETISIIDTRTNSVAATLEAGPDMTGINFAGGKAFVISSSSGFVYVYDMQSLKPAGRISLSSSAPKQVTMPGRARTSSSEVRKLTMQARSRYLPLMTVFETKASVAVSRRVTISLLRSFR
jgi:NAD(P)-dependent dehydrogenase (short-subunit alcohol dehydrogenase family)